jgi:hypothetical protein
MDTVSCCESKQLLGERLPCDARILEYPNSALCNSESRYITWRLDIMNKHSWFAIGHCEVDTLVGRRMIRDSSQGCRDGRWKLSHP